MSRRAEVWMELDQQEKGLNGWKTRLDAEEAAWKAAKKAWQDGLHRWRREWHEWSRKALIELFGLLGLKFGRSLLWKLEGLWWGTKVFVPGVCLLAGILMAAGSMGYHLALPQIIRPVSAPGAPTTPVSLPASSQPLPQKTVSASLPATQQTSSTATPEVATKMVPITNYHPSVIPPLPETSVEIFVPVQQTGYNRPIQQLDHRPFDR